MIRFTLPLILFLIGCNSPKIDNSLPGNFSEQDLKAAEVTFCSQGFTLKEIEVTGDFNQMDSGVKVFGFSSGKGKCALEKDLHDNVLGALWFNVEGVQGCISNGSLWEVTGSHTATPTHYYELKALNDTRTVQMNGSRDLPATYVRDHAGVRPLKCIKN